MNPHPRVLFTILIVSMSLNELAHFITYMQGYNLQSLINFFSIVIRKYQTLVVTLQWDSSLPFKYFSFLSMILMKRTLT